MDRFSDLQAGRWKPGGSINLFWAGWSDRTAGELVSQSLARPGRWPAGELVNQSLARPGRWPAGKFEESAGFER